jgi:predicted negative regulator of RcsB-dependent stress response
MGALDDLLSSWRSNPDADSTIALSAYLGASGKEALVREVGKTAETWHARDMEVMLAVGRMYLDAGLLPESQGALVTAGKADASSPKPFRYLGEVLLRRGDASRAEKVLARAIQLGDHDPETNQWHDRASFYIALQKRVGAPAVATEVEKALPRSVSIPPPAMRPEPFGSEDLTNPRGRDDALPRFDSVSEISQVEEIPAVTHKAVPGGRAPRARTMIGVAPPAAGASAPGGRVVMPAARAPQAAAYKTLPSPPPPRPPSAEEIDAEPLDDSVATRRDALEEPTRVRVGNPFDAPTRPAQLRGGVELPPPAKLPGAVASAAARAAPVPGRVAPARPVPTPGPNRTQPEPFPAFMADGRPRHSDRPSEAPTERYDYDAGPPAPGVLLEHLARVGVYEPSGGARPAWEQPPRQKSRGTWLLIVAIVLTGGGGIGGWQYARHVKAERATRAVVLTKEVDRLLHSGGTAELRSTDQKLSEAFDLDSRSQRAARLWLENRVLRALLLDEESKGIDSAIHRGRTTGLPEKDLAFGRMASFLVEGDLAGAAAQLPKWDKEAGRDAHYQLAAGAVLERAGDLRAIERYEVARSLDPKLVPAEILLARLALFELGKKRAEPVIESLKQKVGEHAYVRALRALAWVVESDRGDDAPADARLTPEDAAKLPAPLAAVPHMLDAARAVKAGEHEKLASSLDAAIRIADSPALAAGLGFLAIEAGDETLARKAALRAVSFAAMYPRARTLAARVALLGGRVDEAEKAVEQLDPTSVDVAVVRAVAAYESLEPADVDAALKVLGEARSDRAFSALAAGSGILLGSRYPMKEELGALKDPSVPWGELVVIDSMLEQGDLAGAAELLGKRQGEALRPVHLLRLARLLRYQGKAQEAVDASNRALEGSVTAPLLVERCYDLVAAGDLKGARTLLARYPVVLGTLSGWLAAFIDAHETEKGTQAQAAARTAKLELPLDASPLAVRLLALRALVVTEDKRAKPYLGMFARRHGKHPEVALAIKDLTR